MPREEFQAELDDLRTEIVELGRTVLAGFERAAVALVENDTEAARAVIDGDATVNRRYLDLESRCIDLLALQQPVAGDLRFVASSFKILTDIERIGDLAVNLAERARDKREDYLPEVNVDDLTGIAAEMLDRALDAYAAGNAAACRAVADQDDELDGLCERVAGLVMEDLVGREVGHEMADDLLAGVRRLLLTVRDIERVGDHAVNIAARTLYMVEGTETLLY
ncbi:phosphate signaling complex protein PhoU [Haloglomus halophilum]|uniref:phosphate signaling complex protein PhoU n=1 Tax=Haloglomus halophilum TaxID=2962672 RepID=UPI0020C93EED|nr:phosphate signaling complex protein PhoU [Haloglomus halophilum]